MEYGIKTFLFTDKQSILGLILLILIVYEIFRKRANLIILWGTSWFLITLLPAFNLYPLNAFMAEHWLYIPAMGFFLTLAYLIIQGYKKYPGKKNIFIVLFFSLLAFYSLTTIGQNIYWQNPLFFYERTLKYSPNSSTMKINLAHTYTQTGRYNDAAVLLQAILEKNPDNWLVVYDLGVIYFHMNKFTQATSLMEKALQLNPNLSDAWHIFGLIHKHNKQYQQAEHAFQTALKTNPQRTEFYNSLGALYIQQNKYQEAIETFRQIIQITPDSGYAYNNIAAAYYDLKDYAQAMKYCLLSMEHGHKPDLKFIQLLTNEK
jgi:tetratricopeptide (TPR) repeat protein